MHNATAAQVKHTGQPVTNAAPDTPLPRGFHWLQVSEVREETRDAVSVEFVIPESLREAFAFSAGQYVTVMHAVNGESLRRPYSLCVAPSENEWRICCKRIPEGRMSGFINAELQAGDYLAVMEPNGRFCNPVDGSDAHHYVGIAGGSGITPVMSLLKTLLLEEPEATFTLFYGNRTTPDIIFREALLDLKNRFLGRLQVFHVLSDEATDVDIFHGMLTCDKVQQLVTQLTPVTSVDRYFICGPGPMMDGAENALQQLGVEPSRILKESFGSAPAPHTGAVAAAKNTGFHANATIRSGGSTLGIEVQGGQSVLDAALAAGLDLPYACKGGVCCTCKARLLEGTVDMAVNYGLEADEIARGYVLTCQAVPTSDKVVVDYDA